MSKITSIATGVPANKCAQNDLFSFADKVYSSDETDSRKLKFLYGHSGISTRYSVIPDYTCAPADRQMYPPSHNLEPLPGVKKRMDIYNQHAGKLSSETIAKCIAGKIDKNEITHLITVSCTGMSAPGLDLQIMEEMQLPSQIIRTSVNFMGCYAAIHGMKIADAFCKASPKANVVVVCTEFCTLHFQKNATADNLTASLLFADGCAAFLMQHDDAGKGLRIDNFFSDVVFEGKKDMSWEVSENGFMMTLSGYVPELIRSDFARPVEMALTQTGHTKDDITHWCMHPGGKKILDAISQSLSIDKEKLQISYDVLNDYGNMSSATVLFVLEKIFTELKSAPAADSLVFGAAFGPGLTMETFTAVYD